MEPFGAVYGRQMMNEVNAPQGLITPLKVGFMQNIALNNPKAWMVLHVGQIVG